MVDKISTYILDHIFYRNETIVGDEREIMKFGITRIIEDIPKYTIIFIISLMLGILPQVGIVLLTIICYKSFVGGAHARTNLICLFSSVFVFIAPVLFAKYVEIPQIMSYALYIVLIVSTIYVITRIVPADTEEIPILNKKKRKKLKILATISFIVLFIIATCVVKDETVKGIILLTILFTNMMAMKFSYKLYKCKYSYESEEFKDCFQDQKL